MRRLSVVGSRSAVREERPPMPEGFGTPAFADGHGRRYTYLRISITDRCDLACVYCMPPGGEEEHALRPDLLTFEEWARVVRVFARGGIDRVRFTGGEPLVRKDVVRLVEMVARESGITDLVMTTNATRLAELARPLAQAGLRGVNVSIDSLDADRFRTITRGGDLSRVLAGIHAALDAGLEVKTNAVLLGGVNDDEAGALVDWAWSIGVTPRFIELMPLGEAAALPKEQFISAAEIESRLGERIARGSTKVPVAGRGPARYLDAADGSSHRVGFITAVSDDFCDACNRVRVTAMGDIRACLASRRAVSLRDLIRTGATDAEIHWTLAWTLSGKDSGHRFNDTTIDEHTNVGMSLIGG
jgi:cyclic pyranopterin phosphate synthase